MKPSDPIHALPTTVFPAPGTAAPEASNVTPKPRCQLAFMPAGTRPTGGELESLLRSRLRIAALIVLVPFVYYFIKRWFDPFPSFEGAFFVETAHEGFIVLTVFGLALLWSNVHLSIRALRSIEFALFGMTAGFFALLQYFIFCIERVCNISGHAPEIVRLAISSSSIRWFFLIVIYGVFIPNTWKRTAIAAISTALLPIALTASGAMAHGHQETEVYSALADMTILLGMAVAVAVFGSYRIQYLAQQAREARELGQYRLKQLIGTGGMGEVYLAEHMLLRRPCAVKLIRSEHANDGRSLQRFEREVRSMATLTHWNTVEIFDYGHAEDGTFYYVMEYLPGQTLDALVTHHGPLPPARAVHFLRQICMALREAHGIGLLHRDIKPGNVFACERGGVHDVAKLLDFGLVQSSGITKDAKLTVIGSIVGSPPFMSPEQASGKALDNRSDIYSVGALGFYLLSGQPPFPRETAMEMLMAHAYEPVPEFDSLLKGVPKDVEDVIRRCLEKDPAKRWPDAASLEKALAACACADEWTEECAEGWWRGQSSESTVSNLVSPATPQLAQSPVPAA